MELSDTIKRRDEILLAMDVEAAKAFIVEHGGKLSGGRLNWEKILHMARFECTSLPEEDIRDSQIWLARNGAESLATIDPDGPYARMVLDLIFPRDDFRKVMAELEGSDWIRPRTGS